MLCILLNIPECSAVGEIAYVATEEALRVLSSDIMAKDMLESHFRDVKLIGGCKGQ